MPPLVHCSDDGMMMIPLALIFRFLQNHFKLSEIKLPPASDIILLSEPYFKSIIMHASNWLSTLKVFCLFDDWELAVIIYNT